MKKSTVILTGLLALGLLIWWCLSHHLPLAQKPQLPAPAAMTPVTRVTSLDISAAVQKDKLILQGAVASEAFKAQIVQQAQQRYGAQNVVDELKVDSSTVATDSKVMEFFPPKIQGIEAATYRLTTSPMALALNGSVASAAVKEEVGKKLSAELGAQWQVNNYLEAPSAQIVSANQSVSQALALESIQFSSGSAIILARSKMVLNKIAEAFKNSGAKSLAITGHTDNTGLETLNLNLSQARADAVKKYLANQGVALDAMMAKGYGSSQPIGDNKTALGRQANRRIDFTIHAN